MHDRTCVPDLELVLSKTEQPTNSGLVAGYYSEHSIVNSADVSYTIVAMASYWSDELPNVLLLFRTHPYQILPQPSPVTAWQGLGRELCSGGLGLRKLLDGY